MALMSPFPKRGIKDMSFPSHLLAPGGGGVPGPSGRRVGKLYLADVAARTAAAQRKEDRTNVLLASTNKTQPSTASTPVAHLPDESLPPGCLRADEYAITSCQRINKPAFKYPLR